MSRIAEAHARLDAALQRLDTALQRFDASAYTATESRDRQIAALLAEIATLKQERDALGNLTEMAATRIDAVMDRLRAGAQG